MPLAPLLHLLLVELLREATFISLTLELVSQMVKVQAPAVMFSEQMDLVELQQEQQLLLLLLLLVISLTSFTSLKSDTAVAPQGRIIPSVALFLVAVIVMVVVVETVASDGLFNT